MSARITKINSLIQQHMGEILTKDISLKAGVFVTVSKVDTTPDLRYTRIFISIFPEKEIDYTVKTLEKELYQIQGKLNKRLVMRPLPKIEFKVDMTESRADEIERLLKEI
ncbi:MAG TPA: 30S ribosome-binding factor RbfA [Candidatus Moranbacteria bacterium]|nr:30S ribosome-binding factor RbfA [Candidatus Moranbacteria bacterium]